MTTTDTGRAAETAVAAALERAGFVIVARNWRTRWCELDIIARRRAVAYIIEVKYRRQSNYGDGLAAITPRKRRQLRFAANLWAGQSAEVGDYQLAVVAVSGANYERMRWCDID